MKLKLNKAQLKQLSQVSGNLSVLFFGFMLAPFVGNVDSADYVVVVSCGLLAFAFFAESTIVLRGFKDDKY